MSTDRPLTAEGTQLEIFRALPGDLAPRDAQDLMAYPFFSLAKTKRTQPIIFRAGPISIAVEGTAEHGIATIWDADVLIWAASQLVEARDAGLPTSRLMVATPYEILKFTQRGTSGLKYQRLRAALDRLQSTSVATSIRHQNSRRLHRFSWINEWRDELQSDGQSHGVQLILPDWFYSGILDQSLVLTIDPAYFELTGGIERWLYRLVRKHAGRQPAGWRFDFKHLYLKSGSLTPFARFAFEVRSIVTRQCLPGYWLQVERSAAGLEVLHFKPIRQQQGQQRLTLRTPRAGEKPEDNR